MSEPRQTTDSETNPLLKAWLTPFATPPFDEITPEHFLPAFEQAFADHSAEIAAITNDPAAPDFANTVTALERSGKLLNKVASVFYDLVSAHSNPAILEIDKEVSLRMARHWNPIMMNAVLFGRIARLHQNRANLGLDLWKQLRLAGAKHRPPASPSRRRRPVRRGQDTHGRDQREAGPARDRLQPSSARRRAELVHGAGGGRPPGPAGEFCGRRQGCGRRPRHGRQGDRDAAALLDRARSRPEDYGEAHLREKVYKAFTARGDNGNSNDNNPAIGEILKLREESCFWATRPLPPTGLADSMAKTLDESGLLERVWKPAWRRSAKSTATRCRC